MSGGQMSSLRRRDVYKDVGTSHYTFHINRHIGIRLELDPVKAHLCKTRDVRLRTNVIVKSIKQNLVISSHSLRSRDVSPGRGVIENGSWTVATTTYMFNNNPIARQATLPQ